MIRYLKDNVQFLLLCLVWIFAGIAVKESAIMLVPLSVLLLREKGYYTEIILTILLINYLSDNRHHEFEFAIKAKGYVLMLAAAFVFLNPRNFPIRSKIIYPYIPFFILAFYLFPRNPDPAISFQKTLSFFLIIAAIPNYFLRQLEVEKEIFLKKFIWLGTLLYILAFIMIFILPEDWTFLVGRYTALLGNPNGVGNFSTCFFLLVSVSLYHFPDMFTRNEKYLIYGSLILSILLASSRNCIFSIAIFLFFSRFYKISPWIGFFIVIVSAFLFQVVNDNLPAIIVNLGLGSYMRVEHLDDGSGRLIAWVFAWEQIQKHYFLLGRGFAFEEWLFNTNREWLSALGHEGMVHNTYLAVWLNTGIIGLILFLFGMFYNFIKASRINPLAFPCLFAILFSTNFESWFQASLNPFTIVALLVLTLLQYEKPGPKESAVPLL
jgi:hypothetical protein